MHTNDGTTTTDTTHDDVSADVGAMTLFCFPVQRIYQSASHISAISDY